MKTNTKNQIIEFINKNGPSRPVDLINFLNLSQVAIQKQLKQLTANGTLKKSGKPPLVFYSLSTPKEQKTNSPLPKEIQQYLNEHYLYITPSGNVLEGSIGFQSWLSKTKQTKQTVSLAQEYKNLIEKLATHKDKNKLIEANFKIKSTFSKSHLDKLYYLDFYSIPKFGRTKLGYKLLHAKQAQNKPMIKELAQLSKSPLEKIIKEEKINAIAWTPHSIPRKIPFLNEFKKYLDISIPEVEIVKAYTGTIPVAQKSLSKLEERIENARDSIFIKTINKNNTRILLIDDALGSGATLNEIAAKLKKNTFVKVVVGFALVGSYKDFEVIKEV